MSFRDNLQYLRATHNMTQEQLAMLLGVSRQSVTKWEAQRSYPEMDKLLKMCEIFGCTLDDLVQGDLAGAARTAGRSVANATDGHLPGDGSVRVGDDREGSRPGDDRAGMPSVEAPWGAAGARPDGTPLRMSDGPARDICGYDEHVRRYARRTSTGIALCIAGLIPRGFLENVDLIPGAQPGVLEVLPIFLGVLAGLAVIVPACMGHVAFQKAHPYVRDFYTEQDRVAARRVFTACLVCGIAFILVGLLLCMAVDGTTIEDSWGSAALFGGIALGVWLIVHGGLTLTRVNVEGYNERNAVENLEPDEIGALDADGALRECLAKAKETNGRIEATCTVIMLIATICVVGWLFIAGWVEGGAGSGFAWEHAAHQPFWLPWVIGGLLCAIAGIVIQERARRDR